MSEQRDGEVEVAWGAVQELAEDNTAGDLHQCPHLPKQQWNRVSRLLAKWKCVFAQDEEDFGQTDVRRPVLHYIPTGNTPPSWERYQPVPPSLYQELRSLLQNMLQDELSERAVAHGQPQWSWLKRNQDSGDSAWIIVVSMPSTTMMSIPSPASERP